MSSKGVLSNIPPVSLTAASMAELGGDGLVVDLVEVEQPVDVPLGVDQ